MTATAAARRGTAREVFTAFLKLGLVSFGGPIAHLGYFRSEFVTRRGWIDDREYASLLALCQFLPGPASSQLGFALGLRRAGYLGALAAFIAFTLPSAALMFAFASGAALLSGPVGSGVSDGLRIVAVAIVAEAVLGMSRTLAPDWQRATIAILAAIGALLLPGSLGQITALGFGLAAGLLLSRAPRHTPDPLPAATSPPRRWVGILSLTLLVSLLVGGPLFAAGGGSGAAALFDTFFRAGALVFGGGHVALPLLESAVVSPGWVSSESFLSGYGAAQALPGPLFSFAAYLGAVSTAGPGGAAGALIALAGIFLPGFLVLLGMLPFWNSLGRLPAAQAMIRGANAAVVGILAAALYSPLFTTAITSPGAFYLALACFLLRVVWRLPAWIVVLAGAAGGALLAAI